MNTIENPIEYPDAFFCERLRDRLISGKPIEPDVPSFLHLYAEMTSPASLWGFAITLTQRHEELLTVVRIGDAVPTENIRAATNALMSHRRLPRFSISDPRICAMTIDFVPSPPVRTELYFAYTGSSLTSADRGLRIVGDGNRLYIFPWQWQARGLQSRDAYTTLLAQHFGDVDHAALAAFAFEACSFQKTPIGWEHPPSSGCKAEQHEASAPPLHESERPRSDWHRIRSILASQDSCGWLVSHLASTKFDEAQVSEADFTSHCETVIDLVEYCVDRDDSSIIPQVTLAIDCALRFVQQRRLEWRIPPIRQKLDEMLGVYQAMTSDFRYAAMLDRLRDRCVASD